MKCLRPRAPDASTRTRDQNGLFIHQDKSVKRGLYSTVKILIGQIAKKAGVTRDTVRFYERSGLICAAERQAGSRIYKDFAPEMLDRLLVIKQAQAAGFTLREIKKVLDEWGDEAPDEEITQLLEEKLRQTEEKIHHLQEIHAYLTTKLARFRAASET